MKYNTNDILIVLKNKVKVRFYSIICWKHKSKNIICTKDFNKTITSPSDYYKVDYLTEKEFIEKYSGVIEMKGMYFIFSTYNDKEKIKNNYIQSLLRSSKLRKILL